MGIELPDLHWISVGFGLAAAIISIAPFVWLKWWMKD